MNKQKLRLTDPLVLVRQEPFFGQNVGIYADDNCLLAKVPFDYASTIKGVRSIKSTCGKLSGPSYCVPIKIQIKITNICNFHCEGCYASSGSAGSFEMSIEQIIGLLDRLVAWGVLIVEWVGGEVFMKKDARRLFFHAHSLGLKQVLLTNGFYFGKKPLSAAKEAWTYFSSIQVSVDGIGNEFDQHTKTKGAWKSVLTGIINLSKTKPANRNIKIATICTADIVPRLAAITSFLSGIEGINVWKLGKLINSGRAEISEIESFDAQLKAWDLLPQLKKLMGNKCEIYHYFDKEETPSTLPPEIYDDPGARTFMYILHDGRVFPRPLMSYYDKFCGGNVLEDKLEDIWCSNIFQKIRSITRANMGCEECTKTCTQRGLDQRINLPQNESMLERPIPHPGCLYY